MYKSRPYKLTAIGCLSVVILIGIGVILLGIIGCSVSSANELLESETSESYEETEEYMPALQERTVYLSDGRTITCIESQVVGAISCDWDSHE